MLLLTPSGSFTSCFSFERKEIKENAQLLCQKGGEICFIAHNFHN